MNIQTYSLSERNSFVEINLNPELELKKIELKQFNLGEHIDKVSIYADVKQKRQKNKSVMMPFSSEENILSFLRSLTEKINEGANKVSINLHSNTSTFAEITVQFHFGQEKLDLKPLFKDFQNHIESPLNTRIIFSAPFGHGKTTFLNTFFEEQENEHYEIFRVFPVNYSVSSNEDIFRYVKTDILFQLLTKDIEFEKSSIDKRRATEELLYLEPKKMMKSLLKIFSSLNSTVVDITAVINNLSKISSDIEQYQALNSKDERKSAMDFIKTIYDKEGSLFEDNFYTQLIRGLIEQIAIKGQETVLIIEDLDRIDPEHIFRILNVISAHYDTYHLGNDLEVHNRFGFDKIILVCDSKNIQNIFHHKYGEKTDFNGYFNKYYSSKPFEFDNSALVKIDFLKQLSEKYKYYSRSSSFQFYLFILGILVENQALSIREIQKLYQIGYSETYSLSKTTSRFRNAEISISCLMNLGLSIGLEKLKAKLSLIKQNYLPLSLSQFQHWTAQLLAMESYFDGSISQNWLIPYKNGSYTFDQNADLIIQRLINTDTGEEIHLITDDFFEYLIRSIDLINPYLKLDKTRK